jgi:cytoskeletal protein CcmA (bactofilin family)
MAKEKDGNGSSVARNNLVKDSLVSGDVQSVSDIRIDGTINGNLSCQAKVVIGALGKVNGNINCQNAVIEGKVLGNIESQQILDIRNTAHIEGDIVSSKLILEDGAYFNGQCKMTLNVGKNA